MNLPTSDKTNGISWGFLLRLFLGLGLLGLVLFKLDLKALFEQVKNLPLWMGLAILGISAFMQMAYAWLTSQILKPMGKISWEKALKLNLGTLAMGYMLPARLGVLAGRPLLLRESLTPRPGLAQAGGVMLLELLPECLRFALVGLIGLLLLSPVLPLELEALIWTSIASYWAFCILVVLAALSKNSQVLTSRLMEKTLALFRLARIGPVKKLSLKILDIMQKAQTGAKALARDRKRFLLCALGLILKNLLPQALQIWLLLSLQPVELPWWVYIVLPSLAYSVSVLPISLSGIGLAEGAGVLFLNSLGVSFEAGLMTMLLDRMAGVYLPVIIGSLLLPSFGLKPRGKVTSA
ncbi:lysylphosphatidylglycerol synthase transmembrane domain-containing protein [Dethiosulfatarculus sandiegensis]|uniref:Flippase-like domain-containing protein n=1 Tax=Dethiosulfatarculus sandiegensis TaxID=1429043 RepID=A0A0D2HK69_9BACT|nr:lysylphosphatidylglycerol synthase transmembrane domain-containing protein [Dethiosulfatarculus sandiegensis]KIX11018.1 hypothetical protein X474_27165 [Dethiosulfatarculus sandiegensis]